MKLQTKTYEDGNPKNTTEYSGAYVYENGNISYINIPRSINAAHRSADGFASVVLFTGNKNVL